MNQTCNCDSVRATRDWCRRIPKAELHAHLSGSIRSESIRRLLLRPGNEHIRQRAKGLLDGNTRRTLKQCFELFPIIHELISDLATLRLLVLEVLHDFARDKTVYLELRTTPRALPPFSARDYLLTVLKAIAEYHTSNPDGLVCRVLVSITRHLPLGDAQRNVAIVDEILGSTASSTDLGRLIVGFELSGNPQKGSWEAFEPLFGHIRRRFKLPVSLHFGELLNEVETMQMLDFGPERVGHAVLLSRIVQDRLVSEKKVVGVEVCITSNLLTDSVPSVESHPVVTKLIPSRHPFCLCTDDCGVFDTSLSEEYGRLVDSIHMSRKQVVQIAYTGLQLNFCRDKSVLAKVYEAFATQMSSAACECTPDPLAGTEAAN